jgi:hypothetical protein
MFRSSRLVVLVLELFYQFIFVCYHSSKLILIRIVITPCDYDVNILAAQLHRTAIELFGRVRFHRRSSASAHMSRLIVDEQQLLCRGS